MSDMTTISYEAALESVAVAKSHGEKFFEQLIWQVENRAWDLLGYGSWDEMREAEYGGMGVVAPRSDRPEFVSRLRSRGLTQKQIAETLGVSDRTVRDDLSTGDFPVEAPPITNSRGQERPASYQPSAPSAPSATSPDTPKSKPVNMALNFEQALLGLNLTLSMGDSQTDLTENQRTLIIEQLEIIINRVKGETP